MAAGLSREIPITELPFPKKLKNGDYRYVMPVKNQVAKMLQGLLGFKNLT